MLSIQGHAVPSQENVNISYRNLSTFQIHFIPLENGFSFNDYPIRSDVTTEQDILSLFGKPNAKRPLDMNSLDYDIDGWEVSFMLNSATDRTLSSILIGHYIAEL